MNLNICFAICALAALTSCSNPPAKSGDSNNGGSNNGGSNNGSNNGQNNGQNNGGGSNNGQTTGNNGECDPCVWEGPVDFTLSSASVAPDGVYLVGDLAWSPCCGPGESGTRTWFVDWTGATEIVTAVPTGTEPLAIENPEAEEVYATSGTTTLGFLLDAQDSVDSTELEVGTVYDDEGESRAVVGPIMVDVSR